MKAFIILNKLSKKELDWLTQNFNAQNDKIWVEKPDFIDNSLPFEVIDIKKVPMVKAYQECHDLVVDFGFKKFGDKKIVDWLKFNNETYWFYTTYKLFNNSKEFFFKRDLVEHCILDKTSEDNWNQIFVFYKSNTLKELIDTSIKSKVSIINKPNNYSKQAPGIVNYSLIFLTRVIMGLFQLPLLFGKRHVILDKQIQKQKIINLNSGNFQLGNPSTEYLLEKSYSDPNFLFLTEMRSPKLNEIHQLQWRGSLFERKYIKKIIHFEVFLFMALFNPLLYFRVFNFKKKLDKIEGEIYTKLNGKNLALFEGLKTTYKTILLSYVREQGAKVFFKLLKSKTFGGAYEQSVENMPLFRVARWKNTKTYGIQHGVIGPLSISYMFNKEAAKFKPWPDFTIVRGKSYETLLTQTSSYPKSNVVSLGQIRTDCIPLLKSLKKDSLHPKLDNDKYIITYASQILPTSEKVISDRLAEDFFNLTKEFPQYQFILKPHPVEKDLNFYHKVAEKIRTKNYLIYQGDLYKLLALSDVVLIFHSTVGGEAVFFEKPVIALDYFNNDRVGYIKDGVAHKALTFEQLLKLLPKVINKEITLNKEDIKTFIADRAHIIDGNTTQRFYDFIRNLG